MSEAPSDLKYVSSHEWIRVEGDEAVIGITDHAQDSLNDIVYVELPQVGDHFDTEQEFGVVESVKSVSDLYMPLEGEVIEVNDMLEDSPETINEDPYGDGWLVRLRIADKSQLDSLMSAKEYLDSIE